MRELGKAEFKVSHKQKVGGKSVDLESTCFNIQHTTLGSNMSLTRLDPEARTNETRAKTAQTMAY